MPQHVDDQDRTDGPPATPAGRSAGPVPEGAPQAPFTLRPARRDGAPADLTDDEAGRFAEQMRRLTPEGRRLTYKFLLALRDGIVLAGEVQALLPDRHAVLNLVVRRLEDLEGEPLLEVAGEPAHLQPAAVELDRMVRWAEGNRARLRLLREQGRPEVVAVIGEAVDRYDQVVDDLLDSPTTAASARPRLDRLMDATWDLEVAMRRAMRLIDPEPVALDHPALQATQEVLAMASDEQLLELRLATLQEMIDQADGEVHP